MTKMRILPTFLMVLLSLPAVAGEVTSQEILHAGEKFLESYVETREKDGQRVVFELGSLDPRLRLAECEDPLSVEFSEDPEHRKNTTLVVSCRGSRPWRLFVSATVEIWGQAYVARKPLGRGTRLQPEMLEKTEQVINQYGQRGYTDMANLRGMVLKRSVRSGTLITPDLLTRPEAVSRGDRVVIAAASGPVVIETRGEALDSGHIGEQIRVQNLRSQRQVFGTITAPGRVEVAM